MIFCSQVFQRRRNNGIAFYQGNYAYKVGFGNVSKEHWLGNEYIQAVTVNQGKQLLRVELITHAEEEVFAEYKDFALESSSDIEYTLRLGVYVEGSDAG